MEQLKSALSDQFSDCAKFEIVLGLVLGLLVVYWVRLCQAVLPRCAVQPVVRHDAGDADAHYDPGRHVHFVQRRAVDGHGGRTVDCPLPHGSQRPDGHRLHVLGADDGHPPRRKSSATLVIATAVAAIIFLLTFVHFTTPNSYLLVVHYDEEAEYDVDRMMRRSVKNRRLRSKTMTRSGAEMTWEVRLDNKQDLVALMLGIEGVHDATLVACQTEAGT